MTTQPKERDPFPEPQTMPSGWDLTALLSAPITGPVPEANDPAESDSCQSPIENPKS